MSEEALRPYFPLPRVLAGLFTVVTRLYGVRIVGRPETVEVYHPDVRYFDIVERDGTPRGGFFLDLYARPKKRGGAWMDECVGRMRIVRRPVHCRWPTSSATSRRRWATSLRCSPITTCSRCSTSSATGCTTC